MSRSFTQCLWAATLLIGIPNAGRTQERLELVASVNNQTRIVEMDATVRGFGVVTAITPVPAGVAPFAGDPPFPNGNEPVAVAGGRYLAWAANDGLLAFDRRTRTVLNANSLLPQTPYGYPALSRIRILEADTHQPRLFAASAGFGDAQLWSIDFRGRPPVRLGTAPLSITAAAYAAATDEVFYLEAALDGYVPLTWLVVVNATTGTELRRWRLSGPVTAIHAEPTGRVIWVNQVGLEARDAATGEVLAATDQFNATLTTVDAERGLLFARQGDFLVAIDPLRLTELGRTRVAFTPPDPAVARTAATLPGRWMTGAYTVRTETSIRVVRGGRVPREDLVEKTCQAIDVDAIDPDGRRRDTADVLSPLGVGGGVVGEREPTPNCWAVGVIVRSPFAPTGLASTVRGRTASFTWRDPGNTTAFEVEVGFAPGQPAVRAVLGPGSSAIFTNVPPGTYYVRLVGRNEVGPSPASNEVRVVVP